MMTTTDNDESAIMSDLLKYQLNDTENTQTNHIHINSTDTMVIHVAAQSINLFDYSLIIKICLTAHH